MRVPLFGIGRQGKTPVVTAKVLQNFFVEYRPQGEYTQVVAHGFPGLDRFLSFGDTKVRGQPLAVEQNDLLYCVHRGVLKEVNNAGVVNDRGMLDTVQGPVMMAHDGSRIVIIDGTFGYQYDIATTTLTKITDSDFPSSPTSVTWQDGFFIVGFDDGKFYISTDGLTWDALDFTEADSNPDRLVRIYSDHGEVIAFGDISTEFYANTGINDFPFRKISGADQEWGLAARDSVVKLGNSVALLCKNRLGQVMIGRLSGHAIEPISTPDIDTAINKFAVKSDCTAHSYLLDGHPMAQFNFPSAGYSFCYDALSNQWYTRKSQGITRHRCEYGTQYLDRTILTDYSNGTLYQMNSESFTENGETIEGVIVGEHIGNEQAPFVIDLIRMDMEVGVGATSGQGADPQVMLQISPDGGKSWSSEMWRSFGPIGEYGRQVEWDRLGIYTKATIKLAITDPVKRTVLGCYINPTR